MFVEFVVVTLGILVDRVICYCGKGFVKVEAILQRERSEGFVVVAVAERGEGAAGRGDGGGW